MSLLVKTMRRAALGAALGAAVLLASCGGGDPVVAFVPDRVLAFGDENSVLTADGHRYSVNAVATDANGVKTFDCTGNATWVQSLAASYGLVFPQCAGAVVDPRSRIYAAALNANNQPVKVVDLADQVTAHLGTDTFSSKDLVALMAGQNDVLEQYRRYPGVGTQALLDAVFDAGKAYAAQVSRIAAAGGKVLVSTVPDIGLSPFAAKENTDTGDTTRAAFISQLVAKFNEGLRVGIANETGSEVAIMLTDELVQAMVKFPSSYGGMSNVTSAVCDPLKAPTVLLCTTDTLVTDGTSVSHLWADDLHLSPNGHAYVGSLARTRARGNPF